MSVELAPGSTPLALRTRSNGGQDDGAVLGWSIADDSIRGDARQAGVIVQMAIEGKGSVE